jgi:hypothetical protein
MKPRLVFYAICLAMAYLIGKAAGIATAPAKGEFFREVPKWWTRQALCVHQYEGSWQDPLPPYFGGMQLDLRFMRRYGGWVLARHGTADRWSPRTQLLVAYRGWRRQGWAAWPNTSRMCGLR